MTHLAYYNEFEPTAAQWLRNLIDAGHIAPGLVDERDIRDVRPDELRGFTQVHLFAGVGVWSHALRTAGWSDDRGVWTISCPCQPFSAAGRGAGFDDERHLWPHAFRLLQECRPVTVFGEQVASPDGLIWLDLVQADLEGAGYATAALDLCAAGVGAPHIRQRLYWVADAGLPASQRDARSVPGTQATVGGARFVDGDLSIGHRDGRSVDGLADAQHPERGPIGKHRDDGRNGAHDGRPEAHGEPRARGEILGLADASDERYDGRRAGQAIGGPGESERSRHALGLADASPEGLPQRVGNPGVSGGTAGADAGQAAVGGGVRAAGNVADASSDRPQGGEPADPPAGGRRSADQGAAGGGRPGPINGFWADADWLLCRDGKWRPTQSRIFPLATGITGRVGALRAYGNAICAPLAASFIEAYLTRE